MFLWKVCYNILPLKINLATKGVVRNFCCCFCSNDDEDDLHLFRLLPYYPIHLEKEHFSYFLKLRWFHVYERMDSIIYPTLCYSGWCSQFYNSHVCCYFVGNLGRNNHIFRVDSSSPHQFMLQLLLFLLNNTGIWLFNKSNSGSFTLLKG